MDSQFTRVIITFQSLQGCANFQAGSALRSKVKNAKLDETGVFGMACKHEHPRRFLNLKRGERYSKYPCQSKFHTKFIKISRFSSHFDLFSSLSNAVYLIKELQEDLGKNKRLLFMYDIGCKLKPHLEVI